MNDGLIDSFSEVNNRLVIDCPPLGFVMLQSRCRPSLRRRRLRAETQRAGRSEEEGECDKQYILTICNAQNSYFFF